MYYDKYIKYKNKYEQLKKQMGGTDNTDTIIDLDSFLPPLRVEGPNGYDYINDKKISADALTYIRFNIYRNYYYIYEFFSSITMPKVYGPDVPLFNTYNKSYDSILPFLNFDNMFYNSSILSDIFSIIDFRIDVPIIKRYDSDQLGIVNNKIFIDKIYNTILDNKEYYNTINKNIDSFNNIIPKIKNFEIKNIIDYITSIIKENPIYFPDYYNEFSFYDSNFLTELYNVVLVEFNLKKINLNIIRTYEDMFYKIFYKYVDFISNFIKIYTVNKIALNKYNSDFDIHIDKYFEYSPNPKNIINIYTEVEPSSEPVNYENLLIRLYFYINKLYYHICKISKNISTHLFDSFYDYDKNMSKYISNNENNELYNIYKNDLTNNFKNKINQKINAIYHIINLIDKPLVVYIGICFLINNSDNLVIEKIGHANSILIYKINHEGNDIYIGIRNEPHGKSYAYCRNSIRKYIRNLFLNNENFKDKFYYIDDIIEGEYGLQVDESFNTSYANNLGKIMIILENKTFQDFMKNKLTINKIAKYKNKNFMLLIKHEQIINDKNIYEIFKIPKLVDLLINDGLKKVLKKYTGEFEYIEEKNESYYNIFENEEDIQKYISSVMITKEKTKSPEYKISNSPLSNTFGYCTTWVAYSNLIYLLNKNKNIDTIRKYLSNFDILNIDYVNKNQEHNQYVMMKHINLYKFIIFALYFYYKISHNKTLNDKYNEIMSTLNNLYKKDKEYLEEIFVLFDKHDIFNKLKYFIYNNYRPVITNFGKDLQDIKNKDKHLCKDNLYPDKYFCAYNTIYKLDKKAVDPNKLVKYNCNKDDDEDITLVGAIYNKEKQKVYKINEYNIYGFYD